MIFISAFLEYNYVCFFFLAALVAAIAAGLSSRQKNYTIKYRKLQLA